MVRAGLFSLSLLIMRISVLSTFNVVICLLYEYWDYETSIVDTFVPCTTSICEMSVYNENAVRYYQWLENTTIVHLRLYKLRWKVHYNLEAMELIKFAQLISNESTNNQLDNVNLNLSRWARLFDCTFWKANVQLQNSKLVIQSIYWNTYLSTVNDCSTKQRHCLLALTAFRAWSWMIHEGQLWAFTFPAKNYWSKATFCLVFRIVFSFSFSSMKSLTDKFNSANLETILQPRQACCCRLSTVAGKFRYDFLH